MDAKRSSAFSHEALFALGSGRHELQRLNALDHELTLDNARNPSPFTPEEQESLDRTQQRLDWFLARTPEEILKLRELRRAQLASGGGTWAELVRNWPNRS